MTNTWPGWQNVGLIGEGSFGKVYKIQREEFGQVYEAALKVITIPASKADLRTAFDEGMDEESVTDYFRSFVEDIVAEFALMSKLKGNSNIVSYEDHMVVQHEGEIGWDILIRMELLTPLTEYEARHPLSEEDVIRLGIDLAHALELCRKRGIIHRDIKPENIFVSKDRDFKLGDFGVARIAEKTISAMSRKGTYNYMAPEVYKGEEYGYAADLYSLGLVLYRFLNDNRTPFLPPCPQPIQYADRERALNARISGQPIPPPAHGSRKLQEIVLKACAYRPKERFASGSELIAALTKLQLEAGAQETGGQKTEIQRSGPQKTKAQGAGAQWAGAQEGRTENDGNRRAGTQEAGIPVSGMEADRRTAAEEMPTGDSKTVGVWEQESRRKAAKGDWEQGGKVSRKEISQGAGNFCGERVSQVDSGIEDPLEKTLSAFDKNSLEEGQQPGHGEKQGKRPRKGRSLKNWYKSSAVGAAILPVLYFLSELSFHIRIDGGASMEDKITDLVARLVNWVHQASLSGGSIHRFWLVGTLHGISLTWIFLLLVAAGAHFWKKMWRETAGKRAGIGLAYLAVTAVVLLFLKGSIRTIVEVEWDCYHIVLGMVSAFGLETWWHFKDGKKKDPAWIWRRAHAYLLIQTWILLSFYIGLIKTIVELETVNFYGIDWRQSLSLWEQIGKTMDVLAYYLSFLYTSPIFVLMLVSLVAARIVQHNCKKRNLL